MPPLPQSWLLGRVVFGRSRTVLTGLIAIDPALPYLTLEPDPAHPRRWTREERLVFDPKKLLDDLLGSQIPGTQGTVRDKAGQAAQLARDNPIATGALAAILLGTGSGRRLTGSALRLGGLAAVAGLAYKAWQDYQAGRQPGADQGEPELLPPPGDTPFDPKQAPQGETEFALAFRWAGAPSYERIAAFARAVSLALRRTLERRAPVYLILDGDIAQTVGAILKEDWAIGSELLVIDGIALRDFDYIDLGRIRMPSYTVPVTIKSLVFSQDPRG
jgi:hypothetical protein